MTIRRCVASVFAGLLVPAVAMAQPARSDDQPGATMYSPATSADRVKWVRQGSVSASALGVSAFTSAWATADDWPREWRSTPAGFGRRFADGEAAGAISNAIEAGLGSLWGEDPRYLRSGRHGAWPRLRHAITTAVLAPRPDGHLAPAWGRFAGNVLGNAIQNTWLPPSATTRRTTALRIGGGCVDRALSNVWSEFWPDLRQRLPASLR